MLPTRDRIDSQSLVESPTDWHFLCEANTRMGHKQNQFRAFFVCLPLMAFALDRTAADESIENVYFKPTPLIDAWWLQFRSHDLSEVSRLSRFCAFNEGSPGGRLNVWNDMALNREGKIDVSRSRGGVCAWATLARKKHTCDCRLRHGLVLQKIGTMFCPPVLQVADLGIQMEFAALCEIL